MVKKLLIAAIVIITYYDLNAQQVFYWDQQASVVENNDTLSLPWAGGINAAQVSTLDLNLDGVDDLVIFDRTSEKLTTILLTTQGYQYAPAYESLFPQGLKGWVLLRDFNCDGLNDLFTHTPFGIKVYRNATLPGGQLDWELVLDPIFTLGSSGQVNLQVNVLDLPGIDDLDGDGDLDILVYNFAVGGGIEYHKNLSIENTGLCGILEFERITRFWGDFSECECDLFAFGSETCEDVENSRLKHIGGKTLLTLDMDDDGDKEVLIGQEDCEQQYFLENIGNSTDALMREFSLEFPTTQNPVKYFSFPASYYEDVDGDGLKDLISSTNFSYNYQQKIDFESSLWFYKNSGSNSQPDFEFVAKDFLQSEMLDLGESVTPSFADYDRDGNLELFISHSGISNNGEFVSNIWFYENTGTPASPIFTLSDQDYLDLGSQGLSQMKIQFVDMNLDGNKDLVILASENGLMAEMKILFNQSNNIFSFDAGNALVLSNDFEMEDQFHISDLNGDQLPDMLLTRSSGKLDYYKNTGSSNSPVLDLEVENFLGIQADFSKKNLNVTIVDINNDNQPDLLTIDERGVLEWYSNVTNNVNTSATPQSIAFEGINPGEQIDYHFGKLASLTTASLFGEIEESIVVGLRTGGMQVLRKSNANPKPPTSDEKLIVIIYPNPNAGQSTGALSVSANREGKVQIISTRGEEVSALVDISPGRLVQFDTRAIPAGLYLVKVTTKSGNVSSKQLIVVN